MCDDVPSIASGGGGVNNTVVSSEMCMKREDEVKNDLERTTERVVDRWRGDG